MARFRDDRASASRTAPLLPSIHFSLPGNVRWNCPILYGNPRLAQKIETNLRRQEGVTKVKANPTTGRLRVLYRAVVSIESLAVICESAIRRAMEPSAGVVRMPSSSVLERTVWGRSALSGTPQDGLKPLLAVAAIGAGTVAVWLVAKAALRVFPPAAVYAGIAAFAGSTATLVYVLNREQLDDRIKRDRDRALRELWRVARPYRRQLALGLLMVVIGRALQVAAVAIVGVIIDSALSTGGVALLGQAVSTQPVGMAWLGLGAAILIAGCALFDYFSRIVWMRAAHRIANDLRLSLYSHIQSIEMGHLTGANRGTYLALLNDDINRIELLFGSVWAVSREVSYGAVSILAFFLVDPAFAAVVSIPLPGLLLLSYSLEKRIRPRYAALREEAGQLHGLLASTLDGVETTRAFTSEPQIVQSVARASERYGKEQNDALNIVATYDPAVLAAANGLRVTTCIAAGVYAAAGNMSVGSYVTLVTLATSLALPLRGVARDFPHILATLASLSRVFEAFHLPIENRNQGLSLERADVKGQICFHDVIFAYPNGQPVFQRFSVDIPAGRVTAFVGATGSGKSTLAKLLLRFYDPDGGTISLDQWDVQALARVDVRRSIGYVGQDVFLFNGSIRDNIAFGRPDADMKSVMEAARIAGAHGFITGMPAGYKTFTGERGQKLSGGERQRVGIARALLLERPIVIFDEATSSLDPITEANLLNELTSALAGKTVIMIAHRLSAVRNADRIHVIDGGAILETGTHDELLEKRGRYARYWALQTQDMDGSLRPDQ